MNACETAECESLCRFVAENAKRPSSAVSRTADPGDADPDPPFEKKTGYRILPSRKTYPEASNKVIFS